MPKKRLSMVKIKEVLRLKYDVGLSHRQIAVSSGVSHSTIADYLRRAKVAGLAQWPLAEELSETELEQRLFAQPDGGIRTRGSRFQPDAPRHGVTSATDTSHM